MCWTAKIESKQNSKTRFMFYLLFFLISTPMIQETGLIRIKDRSKNKITNIIGLLRIITSKKRQKKWEWNENKITHTSDISAAMHSQAAHNSFFFLRNIHIQNSNFHTIFSLLNKTAVQHLTHNFHKFILWI